MLFLAPLSLLAAVFQRNVAFLRLSEVVCRKSRKFASFFSVVVCWGGVVGDEGGGHGGGGGGGKRLDVGKVATHVAFCQVRDFICCFSVLSSLFFFFFFFFFLSFFFEGKDICVFG